jgi:chromate transporter
MNTKNELSLPGYSLRSLILYFLKLGSIGFGGPVALVGYMQRDLVENRKWINDEDFKEGLALSQLAPGPLAAQLAIYLGYVHYRILGATLVGLAFVLPSFIMVLALGYFYVRFNGFPMIEAVFYGVGASIIGIIMLSSYKLTKKSIGKDWTLWLIFIVLAVTTFLTEQENIWLILSGGVLVYFIRMKLVSQLQTFSFLAPLLLQVSALPNHSKSSELFLFFLKAGAFVFGSGLAIVPFLYGGVVKEYGWLNEQQFMDAVAVAMITPGPIVITVGFIGYLVDGFSGACIAAGATFLPCYLFTILPAPYFKKYGKHPAIKAFVDGITAAAVGAIAGAVLVLSKRTLVDLTSISIALVTLLLLVRFKKLHEPILIVLAALTGILLKIIII